MDHFDVTIIGAGVIGLAVAQRLAASAFMRDASIVVLEQENSFGQHISSRNSEVVHAGIYYAPGSLRSRLCVRGRELIYEHCRQYHVPFRQLGKFIVAQKRELADLDQLHERAINNGVSNLSRLDRSQLARIEPAVQAEQALFSPSSGIIDSHRFMHSLLSLAEANGVLFAPGTEVREISRSNDSFEIGCEIGRVNTPGQSESYQFRSRIVINCAGLEATRLSGRIQGVPPSSIPVLHLCKGDYFIYSRPSPFKHLIYPMPESGTVGLGVHATLDLANRVKFGPDIRYIADISFNVDSVKAVSFAEQISRYFPAVKATDLVPGYSGIRPKLSGPGEAPVDFIIQDASTHQVPGLIQLFGIESPGLTASLAIAEHVTDLVRNTG